MASVSIGSGETLLASRSGAVLEYSLLWCIVLGLFLKGVQVYASARYMALSGEHPMESWRHLPGPRAWFPKFILAITFICFPFLLATLSILIGSLTNHIFGITEDREIYARVWSTILIVIAAGLSLRQGYGFLELSQKIIVGALLITILIAAVACGPSIVNFIKGLAPAVPAYPDWVSEKYPKIAAKPVWNEIITIIGIIGAALPAYIGYLGFIRDRKWSFFSDKQLCNHRAADGAFLSIDTSAENLRNGRTWLLPIRIDLGLSFICVFVFSAAFLVLGAELLYPRQLVPDKLDLINHQEIFLTELHPSLLYLYRIGIFAAIGGTVFATFDVWTKTTWEALIPIVDKSKTVNYKKVKNVVMIWSVVGGLIIMWTGLYWEPFSNPVSLVRIPALIGGAFGCGLWCFGVWWIDRKNLPPELRLKAWAQILLILCGATLTILGIIGSYLKLTS